MLMIYRLKKKIISSHINDVLDKKIILYVFLLNICIFLNQLSVIICFQNFLAIKTIYFLTLFYSQNLIYNYYLTC